jgi:hypothetical protein
VVNLHALHPTKSSRNASKKVDYLPWSHFNSLQPLVIAVGCKITKTGGVFNKREARETGTFSTGIYGGLASIRELGNAPGLGWHYMCVCLHFIIVPSALMQA